MEVADTAPVITFHCRDAGQIGAEVDVAHLGRYRRRDPRNVFGLEERELWPGNRHVEPMFVDLVPVCSERALNNHVDVHQ